jgi:hypothetical protein
VKEIWEVRKDGWKEIWKEESEERERKDKSVW